MILLLEALNLLQYPEIQLPSLLGSSIGVSDGVWILLKHLPPGEHTITFSGKFDFTGIIAGGEEVIVDAGATYNLDVIPKYY